MCESVEVEKQMKILVMSSTLMCCFCLSLACISSVWLTVVVKCEVLFRPSGQMSVTQEVAAGNV